MLTVPSIIRMSITHGTAMSTSKIVIIAASMVRHEGTALFPRTSWVCG
jgi:hypothetical protein